MRIRFHFVVVLGGIICALLLASPNELARAQQQRPAPTDFDPKDYDTKPALEGEKVEFEVPDNLETPAYLRFDKPFQQGPLCGPNALFILLRLCDINVEYAEVLRRVPVGEKGASLEDLQRVAREFGLATEIRRIAPEDLEKAPKPILIHINTPARGVRTDGEGHFAVLTTTRDDGEHVGIDSASGFLTFWGPRYYARNGSGYALVPRPSPWSSLKTLRGGLLGGGFIVVVALNLVLTLWGKKLSHGLFGFKGHGPSSCT